MAGIPVVSYDIGDPAYALASHNVKDDLLYPDNRLKFFQYLAHCQWTESEIKNGEFWSHIYPIQGKQLWEWDGS